MPTYAHSNQPYVHTAVLNATPLNSKAMLISVEHEHKYAKYAAKIYPPRNSKRIKGFAYSNYKPRNIKTPFQNSLLKSARRKNRRARSENKGNWFKSDYDL